MENEEDEEDHVEIKMENEEEEKDQVEDKAESKEDKKNTVEMNVESEEEEEEPVEVKVESEEEEEDHEEDKAESKEDKKDTVEVKLESEEEKEEEDHEEVIIESENEQKNHKKDDINLFVERNSRRNLRTIKKINYANLEASDEESKDNESDDSFQASDDSDVDNRKTSRKGKKIDKPEPDSVPKSDFEMMIEKNRAERMAFLQSLKLDEVKDGLSEALDKVRKKRPHVKKQTKDPLDRTSPVRKSERLTNVNINFSEDVIHERAWSEAKAKVASAEEFQRAESLPTELNFNEAIADETLYESFLDSFLMQESEAESKVFCYNSDIIKEMGDKQLKSTRAGPTGLHSLAWYPSAEKLIAVSGDKEGELLMWNVNSKSTCEFSFKCHVDAINHLQFNPLNHNQLISSSDDGTLRCGDMVKQVFTEIYSDRHYSPCKWFDFVSESTYLVSQMDGQIVLVDSRERKRYMKKHYCHDFSLTTVSVHPSKKEFFATAGVRGMLKIWDLRKLKQRPVYNLSYPHHKSVLSAFFSPLTGRSILVCSGDNTINLYNSTNFSRKFPMCRNKKYDTNRLKCKAMWLPNSDSIFSIGSVEYPRRIQVFDNDLSVPLTIIHSGFNAMFQSIVFHPLIPAVVCGGKNIAKVFALL